MEQTNSKSNGYEGVPYADVDEAIAYLNRWPHAVPRSIEKIQISLNPYDDASKDLFYALFFALPLV